MRPTAFRHAERGMVGIIGAAVALPLIVVLIIGVLDLSRAPIAMRDMRDALLRGAYAGEEMLVDSTTPANSVGLGPNMPAAHNFCLNNNNSSNPPASCAIANANGVDFLVANTAAKVVEEACKAAAEALYEGVGLFKYGAIGIEYRVVRVAVDAGTGVAAAGAPTTVATSTDACSGHGTFSVLKGSRANAADVATNFATAFNGAEFGWNVEGWDTVGLTTTTTFLDPYLLIGVAYVEPGYFFTSFGGQDVSVGEYFVRTLNNVAGIQRK